MCRTEDLTQIWAAACSSSASRGSKSGGFRTILACKRGGHCFFLYGFSKSEKANVSSQERKALGRLADHLFTYTPKQIAEALSAGELLETTDEDKDAQD